jgi:hypothetical protein
MCKVQLAFRLPLHPENCFVDTVANSENAAQQGHVALFFGVIAAFACGKS